MSFSSLTWNADREVVSARQARTAISGGWRNYIRPGSLWQPINSEIQSDLTCTTFPGNVQFAVNSQDWSEICIDGTFSMKRHLLEGNGHNAEPEFRMSLAVETQHNVAGHIDEARPAQVVYPGAWDSADLRLGIWYGRSARIEKVVDIHSMPSGDSETVDYSFFVRSNQARVLAGPNYDVSPWAANGTAELNGASAFVARTDSELRGTVLRTPVAWYTDANGETVITPVRVTFQLLSDGETVRATKHIPRALIATALAAGAHLKTDATFTPDADPETSSVDGHAVRYSAGTWDSVRTGAGTSSSDNNTSSLNLLINLDGTGAGIGINRPFITFDTSSIGAGQQMDAATLSPTYGIQSDAASLSSNFTAALVGASPASTTAIVDSDFQTAGSVELATSRHAYGTLSQRTFTLNAIGLTNIDPEGYAHFAIREGYYDLDGNSPSGTANEYTRYNPRPAEYTTPANRPLLTVTHSTVVTSSPAALLMR